MNNNILGTISICKKASKLLAGADIVVSALAENEARLILVASDASDGSVKKIIETATENNVAVLTVPHTKQEMGVACGKALTAVCAITDVGLASSIGKKLSNISEANESVSKALDLKLKRKKEREEMKKNPNSARPKKEKVDFIYDDSQKGKQLLEGSTSKTNELFKNARKQATKQRFEKKSLENSDNSSINQEKKFDDNKSFGDKKPYKKFDDNKSFGDKKPYKKFDDNKSFGDKKPYKKFDDNKSFGGKKPYKKFDDNKSFGDKKPYKKFDDNKSFGDKKPYKKFDDNKSFGDKKPYKKFDDNKSFGDKKPYKKFDDNKSFGGKKPYKKFENNKPRFDKDKRNSAVKRSDFKPNN